MTITLLLAMTLALLSCNNQPGKQSETSQNNASDEPEKMGKTETQQQTDLPPKPEDYNWFFLMCDYTGTYDANQYSKEQLDNTLKYLVQGHGISKSVSIFRPAEMKA